MGRAELWRRGIGLLAGKGSNCRRGRAWSYPPKNPLHFMFELHKDSRLLARAHTKASPGEKEGDSDRAWKPIETILLELVKEIPEEELVKEQFRVLNRCRHQIRTEALFACWFTPIIGVARRFDIPPHLEMQIFEILKQLLEYTD